jgi:hypothetical protein
MPFSTIHNVERGVRRLMSAPRDLPASAPWTNPPITRGAASPGHRALFDEYLRFMGDAIGIAEAWWAGKVGETAQSGARWRAAVTEAYALRFAGPASCPEVVWTIRTFWLRCVAANRDVPDVQRVPPEVFLLYWLLDGQHDEWVQVLTCMPYWPIGLDAQGRWV